MMVALLTDRQPPRARPRAGADPPHRSDLLPDQLISSSAGMLIISTMNVV